MQDARLWGISRVSLYTVAAREDKVCTGSGVATCWGWWQPHRSYQQVSLAIRNQQQPPSPPPKPLEEVCSPHVDMVGMQPVAGDHSRREDLCISEKYNHFRCKFWWEVTIAFLGESAVDGRFEALKMITTTSIILWVVMCLVEIYPQFGAMFCLHLQGRREDGWSIRSLETSINFYKTTLCHISQESTLQQ